ncbi:MAG: hypothetical protein V4526_02535 [Patescibacteria group bacterium]
MAIHHQKKIFALIPAVLLFLVTLGLYGAMHWYISHIKAESQVMINTIAQSDEKVLSSRRLALSLKEVEPLLGELQAYGVNSEEIVGFIDRIEKLGDKTGSTVTIASINVPEEEAVPGRPFTPIDMMITINGSWKSVMQTVELFENLPFRLAFDKVRIYKTGELSGGAAKKASPGSAWAAQFGLKVIRLK